MSRGGAPEGTDRPAKRRDQIRLAARKRQVGAVQSSVPAKMNRKEPSAGENAYEQAKKRSTKKSHTQIRMTRPFSAQFQGTRQLHQGVPTGSVEESKRAA